MCTAARAWNDAPSHCAGVSCVRSTLFLTGQAPYQLEIVRFATDNDSIGSIICKRAEQLNAACVVMCKHQKGKIKEFFVGSVTSYCEFVQPSVPMLASLLHAPEFR